MFMTFLANLQAVQTDYYVSPAGSHSGTYDNWATAATNIQTAVDVAPSGSTIWIGDGRYTAPGETAVVNLPSKKSLTLHGNSLAPEQVVLDGQGARRGLYVSFGASNLSLELNGLTFTNCYRSYHGGGISIERADSSYSGHTIAVLNCKFSHNRIGGGSYSGGAISINDWGNSPRTFDTLFSNCVFSANIATNGGAVHVRNKNTTIVDCRAVGNSAANKSGGGAFWFYQNESVVLRGCTFFSNRCDNAGGGGAVLTYQAPCVLIDCHFEANETTRGEVGASLGGLGGAVYARENLFVTNCVFRNNRVDPDWSHGGAIYVANNVLQTSIYNSLFVGNLANTLTNSHTHAIYGSNTSIGDFKIVNSTIVSNSGGVGVMGNNTAPNVEIRNCIIRHNNLRPIGTSANYHLDGNGIRQIYNTATYPMPTALFDGGGNSTEDPKFVSLADGDFHLQRGSPCIDAGLNQDWMIGATDLDGRPRIDRFSQTVDMGCYEYQKLGSVLIFR